MKTCYKCKLTKNISSFHKNKRQKDGFANYCKDCAKIRNAEYYKATPERNPQRRVAMEQRRQQAREFVWDFLKKNPCVDCGESDIVVLEFDHVTGTKVAAISLMVGKAQGIDTIKAEMLKCEVRCANCHRRVTAQRAGWQILTY